MSDLPEVIYLIKDSCRYEVVWSDSAFPYGDKKYISAAKAKADKLALLHEVAEEYYRLGKSAEEWVTLRGVLNEIKQRIEDEEMSDKLITEPCPWCGSDRIDAGYSRGYAQGDRKRPEIAAGCWDCSATGPVVLVPENSMGYAESAAKWNTMASAE